LSYLGFETREVIIEREAKRHLEQNVEIYISESDVKSLKEHQIELINKMLGEKIFINYEKNNK
jgi:hypothetical protein